MYGLISAFNNFTHANGLDTLVARIKSEVEVSLQIAQEQKVDIYYDRATLLRSMLKLILHLMQTSGTSHRMRNLIESSLPQSLLIIFRYSSVFGAGIYGIAVNIMASFIHDEPTSLSILQEYGLPQAFLASVSVDFPISTEVVSAIPNAFGAICLNSVGMDAFKVANPMDRYFEIFTQETHVRALGESDVPHLLGNSVDELMRHHPSLKEDIMEAIIKMLRTIQKNGEVEYENELNVTQLSLQDNMEPAETPEKEDGKGHVTRSSTFIDLIARFLEGLFQNTAHCREFIRLNGVDVLLQFYRLKTLPFDFAASSSSSSLSYLFRLLIEVNSQPVITSILSSFSTLLQDATGLLPQMNQESHFLPFFKNSSDISNTLIALNRDFRHLISFHCYASLFADIFTTHIFSHNKSLTAILQMLGNETPILVQLVRLHRFCISESISLKYNVSGDSLNASNETLSGKETLLSPAEMIPKELGVEESIADGLQSKGQLGNNARYLRFILGQIPVLLTPFFQGNQFSSFMSSYYQSIDRQKNLGHC
jgi:E3 ubiquitin-protein ligase HUWE1